MRYAVQNDYTDSNPAIDMAGALSTTKARHYPALPSNCFPEFLARLAAYRGRVTTADRCRTFFTNFCAFQ